MCLTAIRRRRDTLAVLDRHGLLTATPVTDESADLSLSLEGARVLKAWTHDFGEPDDR